MNRREFLKTGLSAGVCLGGLSPMLAAAAPDRKVWAALLHLGTNMWCDVPPKRWGNCKTPEELAEVGTADHLRFNEDVWRAVTGRMQAVGMNMIVIDVGEALVYPSHPELAVKGSWSVERFRAELARLRGMGLEPIPKLNFSTAHDIWLKEYARMVSTSVYYKVCADVIRDVCEVFDHPRWFHLGYDEETAGCQEQYEYAIVRQGDLWWHDFLFFVKTVEGLGMRPWIWSDYYWHHPDLFLQRMPKSVLQSNWYYGESFYDEKGAANKRAQVYVDFDKAGFDQVPCGSNWGCDQNFGGTVSFCRKNVSADRLKGYLMAPWFFTTEAKRQKLLQAIDQVGAAMKI